MRISNLSPKAEGRPATGNRVVPALTICALVVAALVPLTVGQTSTGATETLADESVNLALLPGAVASAKSQRMTPPAATYAPTNALAVVAVVLTGGDSTKSGFIVPQGAAPVALRNDSHCPVDPSAA